MSFTHCRNVARLTPVKIALNDFFQERASDPAGVDGSELHAIIISSLFHLRRYLDTNVAEGDWYSEVVDYCNRPIKEKRTAARVVWYSQPVTLVYYHPDGTVMETMDLDADHFYLIRTDRTYQIKYTDEQPLRLITAAMFKSHI